jgi:hypothetical protein
MMILSASVATVHQARGSCGTEDEGIRIAALKLLQSSGYTALLRLRCEVTDAVVIVHGILPSYYLKQMAQTILQRLEGIQSVMNLVEVRETDSCPYWGNEEGAS